VRRAGCAAVLTRPPLVCERNANWYAFSRDKLTPLKRSFNSESAKYAFIEQVHCGRYRRLAADSLIETDLIDWTADDTPPQAMRFKLHL
jgi:hypothetical protein